MQALPIFINLVQQRCVVIGGGEVALRKINMLLKAGARVECYAPVFDQALHTLAEDQDLTLIPAHFSPEVLLGARLVIAATDDESVNQAVSQAATACNIPVNVVDSPSLCTFTMGAIVDRDPVTIAISSEGNAPVLARYLRAKIETLVPTNFGRIAAIAGEFRDAVKQKFTTVAERRYFWEEILQSPVVERVLAGQEALARSMITQRLAEKSADSCAGEVYLVGGGPGDPDLLTLRALRLMQQCDVCVYDKLVSQGVLELVRRDAEMIYVGKARDRHTLPQEEINALLARLALEGKRVLRLKGGDPFIFGRGGEEIETLMAHGVPFQVVPAVSAANGVSAYAGIPLTHRDYAQTCLFTTGHLKDDSVALDWPALVRPNQTVVIYMGLVGLAQICQQLIQHGLPETTPVAVVQQGTTAQQKVVTGDLTTIATQVSEANLAPPCLTIVGEVVKLREKLAWFEGQS